jgi:hypothetical protein
MAQGADSLPEPQDCGGAMSCWAGSWSWRTMPTGQVNPFGPWLQ